MRAFRVWVAVLAAAAAAAAPARAQPAPNPVTFAPVSGQPGKDVVWVPTQQGLVDRMLDMAGATPSDYVVDLGSGDGRTVITAAGRGIRALGIEYNPDMVMVSRQAADQAGVAERARFVEGDIFATDFSDATVLTMFLLPNLNVRLRPTILSMKPGTRVVSNTFDMGDWTPDQTIDAGNECMSFCRAHKWIVPAKVGGVWRLPDAELKLTQRYQTVTGLLSTGGKEVPITDGRLNGAAISFEAGGQRYTGTVTGTRLEAKAGNGPAQTWTGTLDGS